MFEMYNIYPESVTFKDASDLNFPEYRAVIKEPIALNEINERLDKEHEDQASPNLSTNFYISRGHRLTSAGKA